MRFNNDSRSQTRNSTVNNKLNTNTMSTRIPVVKKCCGCIDLKTGVIIIAVLGIVTCPPVSWAVVRHSYAIRMFCMVNVSSTIPDILDINFHNVLSFGLGPNSGYKTTCYNVNTSEAHDVLRNEAETKSEYLAVVESFRWIVLLADVVFLIACIIFLVKIFKMIERMNQKIIKLFLYSAIMSVGLSFLYGIVYVSVCASSGVGFPMYELFFTLADLIAWSYFIIVIKSFKDANQ